MITKSIKIPLLLIIGSFLYSCQTNNNHSPVINKSSTTEIGDLFKRENSLPFIGKSIADYLNILAKQKGIPQRVHAHVPIEWWSEKMGYYFDYVYQDSIYVLSITGKRTFKDWKNGDMSFLERGDPVEIEIPLYIFKKDTITDISLGVYATVLKNYSKAVKENRVYYDRSWRERIIKQYGLDSLERYRNNILKKQ